MLSTTETKTGLKVQLSGCDEIAFAVNLFLLNADRDAPLTAGNRKLVARAIDCFLDGGHALSDFIFRIGGAVAISNRQHRAEFPE